MLASRRQQLIERDLARTGEVRIPELAGELGVSEMTIRRDLHVLDVAGRLRKVRGGAVSIDPPASVRSVLNMSAKDAIGRAAARQIEDGTVLCLDAGTTVAAVAKNLLGRELTVVTTSLLVTEELSRETRTTVHLTGGRYQHTTASLTGSLASQGLREFTVDLAILGAAGVDTDGIYSHYPDDAVVQRTMLSIAGETWLVADASKFGVRALARTSGLDGITRLITDDGASPRLVDQLRTVMTVDLV